MSLKQIIEERQDIFSGLVNPLFDILYPFHQFSKEIKHQVDIICKLVIRLILDKANILAETDDKKRISSYDILISSSLILEQDIYINCRKCIDDKSFERLISFTRMKSYITSQHKEIIISKKAINYLMIITEIVIVDMLQSIVDSCNKKLQIRTQDMSIVLYSDSVLSRFLQRNRIIVVSNSRTGLENCGIKINNIRKSCKQIFYSKDFDGLFNFPKGLLSRNARWLIQYYSELRLMNK